MNDRLSNWLKKEIMPRRKRAAPSRLARWIARVIGFLFLLVLCCFALWRVLLLRDVNSQFARIRAAGYPVSGAELNAWRQPVPDTENGALVLTQAFSLVRTFPDARSNEVVKFEYLIRTNEWSAATRELIEAYVRTNAPALAKAREAFLLSQFRYPVDFSYGPETEMPHLTQLKEMARISALAAALDAGEERAEEWPKQVELQLKIAGTLDDEPIVLSYLVRAAILRMAVRATERSLSWGSPSGDTCKRLQAAFNNAGKTNLLLRAFVGERALMIPIFRLSRKEVQAFSEDQNGEVPPRQPQRYSGKPQTFLWLSGLFERDLNFFLHTMEKSISLASLPIPKSLTLTNYVGSAQIVAEKKLYILSGMFLPSLSRVIVREASTQAVIKLVTTALAVERFRLDRGRLPGDLKELTPQFMDAVPTDFFDGASLRYHRLARGYMIYSVDADGHDDGGREPPEHKKGSDKTSYDLTFIVQR